MIARPDVDSLMAGDLGHWLGMQALVRADARIESNRRFRVAAMIYVPVVIAILALG